MSNSEMAYCPECGIKSTAGARVLRGDKGTIQALRRKDDEDRYAALEREAALVAHVERLKSKIEDYHDENISAEDALNDLGCMARHLPTTHLTRRDLIKQAEGMEYLARVWEEGVYELDEDGGTVVTICTSWVKEQSANLRQRAKNL